jgi:hypothetical protein
LRAATPIAVEAISRAAIAEREAKKPVGSAF